MKINTNTWNKIRYTIYTPAYDLIANLFKNSRRKSIESAGIKAGNKVLIIGAGTGLDLEFISANCEITAIDLTPSMVNRIIKRNKTLKRNVHPLVMDGHCLEFADNSFDVIFLHLILAVIPNPVACIKEAERVLKPGGNILVFDKFVRKNIKISGLRKFANLFANFIFSDITRSFESIHNTTSLLVISDEDADFNGNFRLIKLGK